MIKTEPTKQDDYKVKLSQLKQYLKRLVKKSKTIYKHRILDKMECSKKDAKLFWKYVDILDGKSNENTFITFITEERWLSHFKSTISNQDNVQEFPKNTNKNGQLDYEILDEEIKLAAYILRDGKSPGFDRISNAMLSSLLEVRPEVYKKVIQ